MNNNINTIFEHGIIPLLTLDDISYADSVANALLEGGIPCVEVAYRTNAAQQGIAYLRRNYPEIIVGAGTVTNTDQAASAIDAGAAFLVSPGFDDEVVTYSLDNNTPIIPGVFTPSEVQHAMSYGLTYLKLFPAITLGLDYIRSLAGPFINAKYMVTGGINSENYLDFLKDDHVFACSGSWLLPSALVRAHNTVELTRLIRDAKEGALLLRNS